MKVEYIRTCYRQVIAYVNDKAVAQIDKRSLGWEVWFVDGSGTIGYPTMRECKQEIQRKCNI